MKPPISRSPAWRLHQQGIVDIEIGVLPGLLVVFDVAFRFPVSAHGRAAVRRAGL